MTYEQMLEIVDEAVYRTDNEHLTDIEREVFLRVCRGKKYEEIAADLGFTHEHIATNVAPRLWNKLSNAFGERVRRRNIRGAVQRFVNSRSPSTSETSTPKELVNFRVFISDRSQNPESSIAEQLKEALEEEEVGQVAFIGEDWLQRSDEKLNEYDCFLLLVSSHSADESNLIMQEIQKAKQLRDTRSDNKPAILLVHADSPLSLPLNHPLCQELQGIPQLEWLPTELPNLVQDIMKLGQGETQGSSELELLIQNLSELETSNNWLLTYVGEDQLLKLSEFVNALRSSDIRRIQSCYSYWGVSPTQMWTIACSDPTYHMRKNIEQFPPYARQLAHHVDKERYNFVSLGVGEGSKDSYLIQDFFNRDGESRPRNDFLYLPVDMSLDMLKIATRRIQELPLHRRIAIQRDIETKDGIGEIACIAQVVGQHKPILYGFIGNTIANVEDPEQVLNNIVQVMRAEDLLLFEAQIVDASYLENNQLQATMQTVRNEYENAAFRKFALSALLQNSDLSVEPIERDSCYLVEVSLQSWNYGQFLQIDCLFENNTDRQLFLTFATGDTTTLNLSERINLYLSRKFTQSTLENFVGVMNLSILEQREYLNGEGTGFIVMMLRRQD